MNQPPPMLEGGPPETGAPVAPTSLASRLMNVFAAPGEVFDEIKSAPMHTGNWLVPMVLLAIVGIVAVFVIHSQPAIIQKMHEQQQKMFDGMVAKGRMTQQAADQAVENGEKYSSPVLGSVTAIIMGFLALGWWTVVLWALAWFILKARVAFGKAVEVAGVCLMVAVLGKLVSVPLIVMTGNVMATPSLGLLIPETEDQTVKFVIFSMLNPFSFWFLAVAAVGLSRLCRVPYGKAVAAVCGYWLAQEVIIITVMAIFFSFLRAVMGS